MEKLEENVTLLSDLEDGESGVIVKVKGYGAFRKRIMEMGFVAGTPVKAIRKAPLQDPVEYELMGYRVSLRQREARQIETLPTATDRYSGTSLGGIRDLEEVQTLVREKSHTIHVALVGNPNCGKTTLFNQATGRREKVGNYGGVTVDVKTAVVHKQDYTLHITDLPGTYSLSEFSPEELFVRRHLLNDKPDIVINVVDASNLERNLFLTMQLIDMNLRVVLALNMYDELEKKGDRFDYQELGKMIGIPIMPTVASRGRGLEGLLSKVIEVYEEKTKSHRHIHVNHGIPVNQSLDRIRAEARKIPALFDEYHSQYVAVKLLENDRSFREDISSVEGVQTVLEIAAREAVKLEKEYGERPETILTNAKYAYIRGALKETLKPGKNSRVINHGADRILTNKWLGFPLFIGLMWLMFQATFTLGSYPMDWIDQGVAFIARLIENSMAEGPFRDLLVDGVIGGVGGVIVFLPNILILFFSISLMEDTGYMARAAFIMDKLMHRIGLHGKSFIPLLMGFGCNVPAVMATRTLENRKDRLLTMLIIPFMSCSARLPVYILLISAFFPENQGLVMLSVYLIGVVLAVLMAMLFKRTFFRKKDIPFVMELPPYRIPTLKNTLIHMWDKSVQYLTKMGTIILTASILIWAMGYFPRDIEYSRDYDRISDSIASASSLSLAEKQEALRVLEIDKESERMENSYIGRLGHFITPVIEPLGFDWKIGVSIITGLAAKEIVIGTMGVLYQSDLEADETSVGLQTKLQEQVFTRGPRVGEKVFTPLVAYTLMLFILIYFPCVAVIAAVKRESNWNWAVFTMVYTTVLAWIVAWIAVQIGKFFM